MKRKRDRSAVRPRISPILGFLCCLAILLPAAEDKNIAYQTVTMAVAEICTVAVSGNPGPLTVTLSEDGSHLIEPTDISTSIGFTSTVRQGQSRSISVLWQSGSRAPSGCELHLRAADPVGKGQGQSRGWIALSDLPRELISGIQSCATGGSPSGPALEFKLAVITPTALQPGEKTTARIILTLTDEG
jgi:hypothetical protein